MLVERFAHHKKKVIGGAVQFRKRPNIGIPPLYDTPSPLFHLISSSSTLITERERERERERQRQRQRQTDRQTDRQTERQRERQRETDRQTDRERLKQREREREVTE